MRRKPTEEEIMLQGMSELETKKDSTPKERLYDRIEQIKKNKQYNDELKRQYRDKIKQTPMRVKPNASKK